MGRPSKTQFNSDYLNISSGILRALAHPLRLRILGMLCTQQPLSVHVLYTNLNIEQSVASQHLRILRDAKLVLTERRGKFIEYLVNENLLERAALIAGQLVQKKEGQK